MTPAPKLDESAPLARLYTLWFALRARCDQSVGAPAIEYRDRIQSSAKVPTTPPGFGRGHLDAPTDTVTPRINLIAHGDPEAGATLRWFRNYGLPLATFQQNREVTLREALEACGKEVAGDTRNARWLAVAEKLHPVLPDDAPRSERDAASKRRNALVADNRRAWGRKALARACDAWGVAK